MLALVSLLLGVAVADPVWQQEHTFDSMMAMDTMEAFKEWSFHFDRDYRTNEEAVERYMHFLDNLYDIAYYNSQDLSFKLRLNQFGDMSGDEFRRYVHGDEGSCFRPEALSNRIGRDAAGPIGPVPAPETSVDWTTKGMVTPVKNQGQCGSCWAFSATGAIECGYAIKHGQLNSLSEQQLVDCAGSKYGCYGCSGGQMSGGMQYAADNGGLCTESEYRYTARDGSCKATSCGTKYDAPRSVSAVTRYSSSALESATAQQCISIGIEADQTAFQHYSSGVLTGSCGTRIDHGVLIVGYGTSGSQDYWKVKNSWGSSWGERGYILICRNCNKNGRDGECGILMEPYIPTF